MSDVYEKIKYEGERPEYVLKNGKARNCYGLLIDVHDLQETIAQQKEEIELLREALWHSMKSLRIMTEDTIDISDGVRNLSLYTLVDCDDILDEIKLLAKGGE